VYQVGCSGVAGSQQSFGGREDEGGAAGAGHGIGHRALGREQQDGRRAGAAGSALPCHAWPGHTMLQLARTSTAARKKDSAVDTVVQQRSRAPRGKRETRAPSLKVTKASSAGLTVSRAKARRPWVCTKHVVQTRRHRLSAHESSARRTRGDLAPTGCTTAPPSPLPAAERQGHGGVRSVAACVCASEWCAVVQESSIRGKGWGTCSSSPVTSKPTPMGSARGRGVWWSATRVSCIRQRSQDKIGEYLLLYLHLST